MKECLMWKYYTTFKILTFGWLLQMLLPRLKMDCCILLGAIKQNELSFKCPKINKILLTIEVMWTVTMVKMMLQMIYIEIVVAGCTVIQIMKITGHAPRAYTISNVQNLWLPFEIVCYCVWMLLQGGTDCSRKSCF